MAYAFKGGLPLFTELPRAFILGKWAYGLPGFAPKRGCKEGELELLYYIEHL